ncbi:MAG TPA: dodecin family protein [Halanaerobiales bacterium]|nr:dodecin family protein [Halanaerobiales bacterium]
MPTTVKIVELVGESDKGWEDAVKNAIREASKTINGISGVEVLNVTADVKDGEIIEYKADLQIAFPVQR